MTRRRALVTGAAGFLGRHVVRALAEAGWDVTASVRRPDAALAGPNVRQWVADLTDIANEPAEYPQADAVCHAAAFIPPDNSDPTYARQCFEVNALATLALARWAAATGARFVYVSAGNWYEPGNGPADEADPVYPSRRAAYYLASKLSGEIFVEHLRQAHGLDAVSLRVSSPYGPGMPTRHVVARFFESARAGRPLAVANGGRDRLDFVYVGDVAAAVKSAMGSTPPGVYNVGSGVAHSVLELAKLVAGLFSGRAVPIEVGPETLGGPAGFRPVSVAKAQSAWGYEPTPLADGLRATLAAEARACA